jgi:hypothetical protein
MRTRDDCTARVLGSPPWQDLDCSGEPLPDAMRILLWVIDGAERRHEVTAHWSGQGRRRHVTPRERLRR